MCPGCSCKSDRPIKPFSRERAPRTHGTVHSRGAHLGIAWSTKMYMQLLGTLWGGGLHPLSNGQSYLDQSQAQLSRDPGSTQESCSCLDPLPTGAQWWVVAGAQPRSLLGSRGPHSTLCLKPAPHCTSHDGQTKAQEWDYKGYEWPLAPVSQLS